MSQEPENKANEEKISLNIQLGDIIQIKAPVEEEIHDKIFLVKSINLLKNNLKIRINKKLLTIINQ